MTCDENNSEREQKDAEKSLVNHTSLALVIKVQINTVCAAANAAAIKFCTAMHVFVKAAKPRLY